MRNKLSLVVRLDFEWADGTDQNEIEKALFANFEQEIRKGLPIVLTPEDNPVTLEGWDLASNPEEVTY